MHGLWVGLLLIHVYIIGVCTIANAAEPTLSHTVPGAALPGVTTEIHLHGANFQAPLSLWFSSPLQSEVVLVEPTHAVVKVTVPAECALGPLGMSIATVEGVSNSIGMLIDDLPSAADNGANHTRETAQVVPALIAIDGTCDGSASDFYSFPLSVGERIAVEVVSQAYQSPLDSVLRLYAPDGKELLLADDHGAGPESRFSFVAPVAGNYLLEISDNRFTGGGRYRLRIGDFPRFDIPFPLATGSVVSSETSLVSLDGFLSTLTPLRSAVSSERSYLPVAGKLVGGRSSAWSHLLVSPLPETIEMETNDSIATANRISYPCGINGKLDQAKDRDHFTFFGRKGETIRIASQTRSLGSPAMLMMRLFNAASAKVAETPVGENDEWRFDYAIAEDGLHTLEVVDLSYRGGSNFAYHVSIEQAGSFRFALKPDPKTRDRFAVPIKNGVMPVDFVVERFGYAGPIDIAIDPPIPGLRVLNPNIAANVNEGKAYLFADENWTAPKLEQVRLVAQAIDAPKHRSYLQATGLSRVRAPHVLKPIPWQDGNLVAAAIPEIAPFFQMTPATSPVYFVRAFADASTTLNLKRNVAEFKDPVAILPESLKSSVLMSIKVEGDNYTLILQRNAEVPGEPASLRVHAIGDFQQKTIQQTIDLPIQWIDPITVAITPSGTIAQLQIAQGQMQKAKITVVRQGVDPQPIAISWKGLPAGITGSEGVMIPADQNEVEVTLTAAADAPIATTEVLMIEAVSTYGGREVRVVSPPAKLEVIAP